ncbi:hypothetical protein SEUBUCD646_0H03790 [Saccharomyces eubayanus]|uniref:Protein gds1 n=2 Tax=Saccharomyces TaxID=4930 RepID=A0A6C1E8H3_SACPS|nr:Protein gds1 [Saccharomyces pastorianus]CAI2033131.1 hypothetical protein SEUBUCD650_0H03800 [Saccharomyces eubayanus]CAI2045826.1 hypothetical protein SEUBUCD646_0H03790 [Saccharomyces eubayanus]
MALANSRPLQITTLENEILHNSNSPVFQLSSMGFTTRADTISNPGTDLVGNQPSMNFEDNSLSGSSFSSSSSQETKTSKSKKDSAVLKKDNPLLEISKLIPVTGERPKPENRDSPLDDDVLHAVFVILWEMDPNQQGMTVKQLCDLLLQKHPDMSNLSTKLSNLISAKLNAYVKKIEKGEKTLIYALSREWSNSSPRRMLYIYRGILSPDYKEHAQAVTMQLKQQLEKSGDSSDSSSNGKKKKDLNSNQLASNDNYSGPMTDMKNLSSNSSFSKNLNVGNLAFSLSPEFNIPYSTSPVSLNLSPAISNSQQQLQTPLATTPAPKSKKRNNLDEGANDSMTEPKPKKSKPSKANKQTKSQSSSALSTPKKVSSSTSLSAFAAAKNISPESAVTHNASSSTYVTAAAAAPRLSKLLPKNGFKKNSRSSLELAAIHKVISTQTPIESSSESSVYDSSSNSPLSITTAGSSTESLSDFSSSHDNETESNPSSQEPRNEVTNWMKIVRNGFLTHDIESPESITLDDLENIFN